MSNDETDILNQNSKLFSLPPSFDPTVRVPVPLNLSYTGVVAPAVRKRTSLEGKVGSIVDARNYRGNGHWVADIEMGKSNAVGFIYVIRNLEKNRYYIGKKFYKSTGKLTRGKVSNWPWYISSCTALSDDAKSQQKLGFDFIFIEEYISKGALSWAETWSICHAKTPENTEIFYNILINKVSWKVKEKITDKHIQRLEKALKGEPM